jgi:nucleotide-binding universal stress UspA family protein
MKILVAVDGSQHSLSAVRNLIAHVDWYRERPEVQLVYVNPRLPYEGRAGSVLGKEEIERYYREEGEAALAEAKQLLKNANIPHAGHVFVGPVAETLVEKADSMHCDLIMIGTHGRTAATSMLLGSIANKVLHVSNVPVLLVRSVHP